MHRAHCYARSLEGALGGEHALCSLLCKKLVLLFDTSLPRVAVPKQSWINMLSVISVGVQ